MITLLIVLGSIVAYVLIGALIARASIPGLWVQAGRRHAVPRLPEGVEPDWFERQQMSNRELEQAEFVRNGVVARVLCWPIAAPFGLLFRKADDANPHEQRRTIEAQQAEIERLEHELGMRR